MNRDINLIEQNQEKKRSKVAIIISTIIHLIILFLIIISGKIPDQKKSPAVMTVKLTDKIREEMRSLPQSEKEKIRKKREKSIKKLEKKLEKRKKQIEKDFEKQTMILDSKEEKSLSKDSDIFKEYEKQKVQETKDIEKTFFQSENNDDANEKEVEIKKLEEDLESLDKALEDLDLFGDIISNESKNGIKKAKTGEILWEDDVGRDLIYKTDINISDEFKEKGLKTSLKIKFTVFDTGIISNVEILVSTGFTKLDQDIIRQFKNWKFKRAEGNFPIYGITEFNIGY